MTFAHTLFRVAAACLLAAAAHAAPAQPPSVPAAAPDAPVPALPYLDAARYRAPAPATASPDRGWREQNQVVGASNSMTLTMGDAAHAGHGAAHDAPTAAADPHAAHRMQAMHASGTHAACACCKGMSGTPAPAASPDPHAAHRMPAAPEGGSCGGCCGRAGPAGALAALDGAAPPSCMAGQAGAAGASECCAGGACKSGCCASGGMCCCAGKTMAGAPTCTPAANNAHVHGAQP